MTDTISGEIKGAARTAGVRIVATALGLVAVAAVALYFVYAFAEKESQRDLRAWQTRLGIVADSRAAAVAAWLQVQIEEIRGLAQDTGLQLYMSELTLAGGDIAEMTDEPAQASFLRNFLVATAERAGFTGAAGVAGLQLIDARGRVLVTTPDAPALDAAKLAFVLQTAAPEGRILDLHLGAAKTPSLGVVVPVFGVQDDPDSDPPIGHVIGIKEVAAELYPLLRQPGSAERTAEGVLVRARGNVVEYLSPLLDGTPPLSRAEPHDTPELAAGFALDTPGGFALARDYQDREVLVVSRVLEAAPWTLMYKVDRDEALANSDTRFQRIIMVGVLLVAVVGVAIVAVWRHGSSRRAAEAAARFQGLARRFETQGNILTLVSDSQSEAIFITDRHNVIRFANALTAKQSGVSKEEIVGKKLAAVVGGEAAKRLERLNRAARAEAAPKHDTRRDETDGRVRVIESEHIPLAPSREIEDGTLVVERDITATVLAHERRERTMNQLVEALCGVVDRRDPFAADHSARVAAVASAVAEEMRLDDHLVAAARVAGRLMNLGKILVPKALLTKRQKLTEAELKEIRESILVSADLVQGIEFDGPVVETLRQLQECWDGSGYPRGLAGDQIVVTARVCAVANAFVGMVSARAWRGGLDFDQAATNLLSGVGKAFDRGVVAALVNYLDNRGGRDQWASYGEPPATDEN